MDIILKNRIGSDSKKTLSDHFWCVDRISFFFYPATGCFQQDKE